MLTCSWRAVRRLAVLLLLLLVSFSYIPIQVQAAEKPVRVLVIFYGMRSEPAFDRFSASLHARLERELSVPVYLYVETFHERSQVIPDSSVDPVMESVLRQKYSEKDISMVVAVGRHSVAFLDAHKAALLPDAKTLPVLQYLGPPAKVSRTAGIVNKFDMMSVAQLAVKQNPSTRRILLIVGSSGLDREGLPELASAITEHFGGKVSAEVLPSMKYDDTLEFVSHLPKDTVSVAISYSEDSAGENYPPSEALASLAKASNRPMYAIWRNLVGQGFVGAYGADPDQLGDDAGMMCSHLLHGTRPEQMAPIVRSYQEYIFDWPKLEKWGIKESQLPTGSIIINRQPSLWELYRYTIIAIIGVILLQSLLIVQLVRMYRRQRRAKLELHRHAELEGLVADLSAEFIDLPAARVNASIEASFERMLDMFDIDRVTLFEGTRVNGPLMLKSLGARKLDGVPPPRKQLTVNDIPGAWELLHDGKPLIFENLEDPAIPDPAIREFFRGLKIQALVSFPLFGNGQLVGAMNFACFKPRPWDTETLQALHTVADLFGNALQRKRSEEELITSEGFKTSVLESLGSQVAVLDAEGKIVAHNASWMRFANIHGGDARRYDVGENYVELCRVTGLCGAGEVCAQAKDCRVTRSEEVAEGIEAVCKQESQGYEIEYLCPTPAATRWMAMIVTPFRKAEGGAVVVHRDITERKRTEQSIHDLGGRLINAQENERARIARELHDDINQQLALLAIEIQQLRDAFPGNAALGQRFDELWKKTHEVSTDVQHLSHSLHSTKLEHLGLAAALKGLVQEFSRQRDVRIELRLRDAPSGLGSDVSLTLFRVAQEAFSNVVKHSQAREATLELLGEGRMVILRVTDDGIGFSESPQMHRGLGMVSMQERLRSIGGRFSVKSAPGEGTCIEARVELRQPTVDVPEAALHSTLKSG